jgi:hypothetical protein
MVTASVPPKRYRAQTVGGSVKDCTFNALGCGTPATSAQPGEDYWSGANQYLESDCLGGFGPTGGAIVTQRRGSIPSSCSALDFIGTQPIGGTALDGRDILSPQGWAHPKRVQTQTYLDYIRYPSDNPCFEFFGSYRRSESQAYVQFINEDTEDMAQNRRNTQIADWTPCTGCTTYRVQRTAGQYSFGYRALQYRINASGCVGTSNIFNVYVDIYSRPYPSTEAYRLDGQLSYQINGSVDGNVQSPWIAVPTITGREILLQGCLVVPGQ